MPGRGRIREAWREYAALDGRVWVLAVVRAVNTAGLSLVMAFMAIYLIDTRGLSGTLTGALYAGANILQALAQAWAGDASDRVGRKRMMAAALFARVLLVATLGLLVANDAPVWAVMVVLYASWIVRGVFEPVGYAAVADIAPPGQRVAAFGLQKIGVNLGWAIGPAVGGLLMRWLGYGAVFFCSAPVILIAAIAVTRIEEPVRHMPTERTSITAALGDLRANRIAMLFLFCALLSGLVHGQLFSTFSVYAKGVVRLDEDLIGRLWLINGVLVILLQIPAVVAIGRIGVRGALVVGPALYMLAFLGFGEASGFGMLALSIAVLTIGEVIQEPAQQTAAAALSDPNRMGRAMGLLGLTRIFGLAFSLLVGGLAYDLFGHSPRAMWALLAAIAGALAIGHALFGALAERRGYRPETPVT